MIGFEELKGYSFAGKIVFVNAPGGNLLRHQQPPLGLMSLMGACRELAVPYGFVDSEAFDLSDDEIIDAIVAGNYDYVGVALFSPSAGGLFGLLTAIKARTGVKVIVGGPCPTIDAQWLMARCPAIDYAVLGEGEAVLPQLLLAIEGKLPLAAVPRVAYRQGGDVVVNSSAAGYLPGDQVPRPDFDSVDLRYYGGVHPVGAWPSMNLLVTRGCPFKCTFCSNPIWNHRPNSVPAPTVIGWLKELAGRGVREVFFVDDTLNIDGGWFEDLCHGIITAGLQEKMVFKGPFRANLTSPGQLQLAKAAGFWLIFYGVESGCQRLLDYYRKEETVADMADAIRWTREAGLKSQASMIAGAPIDTVDSLMETASFLRRADPDFAPTHPLVPYVGTKIAEDVVNRGLLSEAAVREYSLAAVPTIRTETLTTAELLEIIDFMRGDFVAHKKSPERIVRRCRELSARGADARAIRDILAAELLECEAVIPNGVPPARPLLKGSPALRFLTDELHCGTFDSRLLAKGWYGREEKCFRWSAPVVECPFFLERPRSKVLFHWATLREGPVSLGITINDGPVNYLTIEEGGWRYDGVWLTRPVAGEVWVKVAVIEAPGGDNRPRGMAFRSIRFEE